MDGPFTNQALLLAGKIVKGLQIAATSNQPYCRLHVASQH